MFKAQFLFKRLGQFFLHLLFWSGVLLFYTYFFGFDSTNFNYVLSFSIFLMPSTIATTYVFIYKLIPEYLITKRYGRFAFYSMCTIIISAYLIILSVFYGLVYLSNFEYTNMAPISRSILLVATAVYLVVIIASGFKLLKLNLKHAKQTSALETKILETQLKLKEQELQYLKMQIHPHFLFNTLNTMYGFALKKANETPEMILKLSNLLDYLLYQVDKPFVPITTEINHIKDYIELEKLRFNNTLNVNFKHTNISESIGIAPMLLLPFIENSFKHGSLNKGILSIDIALSSKSGYVDFKIENDFVRPDSKGLGIGLKNIKKRLDLLYKNNYTLSIDDTGSRYKVHLNLKHN